jgi:hypothetical protein
MTTLALIFLIQLQIKPTEYIEAHSLLTMPYGAPVPVPRTSGEWQRKIYVIKKVAEDLEICDRDTTEYWLFSTESQFAENVDNLRKRIFESQGWPLISEAARFPSSPNDWQIRKYIRDRCCHLEKQMLWESDRRIEIATALHEMERIEAAYRSLSIVTNTGCSTFYRRERLNDLRHEIGYENFETGTMPEFWGK